MPEDHKPNHEQPKELLDTREAAGVFCIGEKAFRVMMKKLNIRPIKMGPKLAKWDRKTLELVRELLQKQPNLLWDESEGDDFE